MTPRNGPALRESETPGPAARPRRMKAFAALLFCILATACFGQNRAPEPLRFAVRHADPWMVKALLEGASIMQPELSTIWAIAGQAQVPAAVNALFKNGRWVVNPTDNSLWFFPDRS